MVAILTPAPFFMGFALLRVFSVFTTVSTMGVVLGVASLVVVLAVTSGFEREFEDKVLAVNAHLLVMSYGEPSLDEREKAAEGYMKKLHGLPGLRKMAKFSLSAGEVMIGKVGANLKGIDLDPGRRGAAAGDARRRQGGGSWASRPLAAPAAPAGQAAASRRPTPAAPGASSWARSSPRSCTPRWATASPC